MTTKRLPSHEKIYLLWKVMAIDKNGGNEYNSVSLLNMRFMRICKRLCCILIL